MQIGLQIFHHILFLQRSQLHTLVTDASTDMLDQCIRDDDLASAPHVRFLLLYAIVAALAVTTDHAGRNTKVLDATHLSGVVGEVVRKLSGDIAEEDVYSEGFATEGEPKLSVNFCDSKSQKRE